MDHELLNKAFLLGDWRIDPLTNTFKRDGLVQHIEPKVMDVLVCLAREAGEVVKRDSLLEMVWGDVVVTDEVLTRCISELRAALGDTARERVYIRTVPKRGYSLLVTPRDMAENNSPKQTPEIVTPSSLLQEPDPKKRYSPYALVATFVLLSLGAFVWWVQSTSDPQSIAAARPDLQARQQLTTVAVLPFANLSGDEDSDYFSDGLTEDIRHTLIHNAGSQLRVVARASSEVFRNKAVDIREIGKQLGAQLLVEGTVRINNDRVRVTAQLSNVNDGFPVWAERFEYAMSDILNIQSDIADQVVWHVAPTLKIEKKASHMASAKAYDYYLLGRHHWNKRTTESLKKAAEYFKSALETDSNYALALSGLADTYVLDLTYNDGAAMATIEEAMVLAQQALKIDPALAEANASLGVIHRYKGENDDAKKAFQKAVDLNPGYAMARMWLGNLYLDTHEANKAFEHYSAALKVDPLNPVIQQNHMGVLMMMGRYEEARELLNGYANQQGSEHALKKWMFGMLHAGMYDGVLSLAVRQNFSDQTVVYAADALTQALIFLGRLDEASDLIVQSDSLFSIGRRSNLQAMLAVARRSPSELSAAVNGMASSVGEREHFYEQCAEGLQNYWKGLALIMGEDYQQAATHFKRSLQIDNVKCELSTTVRAELSAYYAKSLYRSGNINAARRVVASALSDLGDSQGKGVYGPELLLMRVALYHAVEQKEERAEAQQKLMATQWPYYGRLQYMPLFDNSGEAFLQDFAASKVMYELAQKNSEKISLSKFGI